MAKSLYDGRLQRHRPLFIYYAGLPSVPTLVPLSFRLSRLVSSLLLEESNFPPPSRLISPGKTNLICVVGRGATFTPNREREYGKFHLRSRVRLKLHTPDGLNFIEAQMNEMIEERRIRRHAR